MKTDNGVDFTYKQDGESFTLFFSINNSDYSIPYQPYFSSVNDIEIIRMGFAVDDFIKNIRFQNEVKKYYANKQ